MQRNSLPAQWETSQRSGSESSTCRTSYSLVWNFSQSDEPTVYGQLSSLLFPCRNSSQSPRRRTDGVRNCQCSVQLWVLKEDSKSEEWWATGFVTLCKTIKTFHEKTTSFNPKTPFSCSSLLLWCNTSKSLDDPYRHTFDQQEKLKRASITIQSTWLLSLYFTLPVFFPYLFCSTPGHQLEWKPFPTQHLLQLLACGSQRWKYCYTLAYSVKKRSIGKKNWK